jgi:CHASE2 domain-containing sensor protein
MSVDEVIDREIDRLQSLVETRRGNFWVRLRRSRVTIIVLFCTVAILHLRGLPRALSGRVLDAALIVQSRVPPRDVRLVTISNEEYAGLFQGRSPLDPDALGRLLTAIWKGRPGLIVVDLDTSHPMFRSLAAPRDARIVWAIDGEDVGNGRVMPQPAVGGLPMPSTWSTGLALVPNDERGIVRGYRREFVAKDGTPIPSIEFAAAQAFRNGLARPVPMKPAERDRLLDFRYDFRVSPSTISGPMSVSYVLKTADKPGWSDGLLRNKVVILGGAYSAARDSYATPVGLLNGSEIVAQATQAELDNTGIPLANSWIAGLIQVLAGFGLVVLYQQFSLRIALVSSLFLIPVLSFAASLILFHRLAMWAAMLPVLLAVLVTELYSKATFFLAVCRRFSAAKAEKTNVAGEQTPETKGATAAG